MDRANSIFDQIDKDKSGGIDKDELLFHLLELGQEYETISDMFARLDTDNDGLISRQEFVDGFERYQAFCRPPWEKQPWLKVASLDLPPPDPMYPDDWESARLFIRHFSSLYKDLDVAPQGASTEAAHRWLKAALLSRSKTHETTYKDAIFWLLSCSRPWGAGQLCLSADEPRFSALKACANEELDKLGVEQENEVYLPRKFGELLGDLGAGFNVHPRQDEHAGLALPDNFDPPEVPGWFSTFGSGHAMSLGFCYILLLRIAAISLDAGFQATAQTAFEKAGGVTKREPPAVKSFMRMWSKLVSDHVDAPDPKPAENADTNRVAWVIECEKLEGAYNEAAAAFAFIGEKHDPIRVKNNYHKGTSACIVQSSPPHYSHTSFFLVRTEFPALELTKGYRALLANYLLRSVRFGQDMGRTGCRGPHRSKSSTG